MLTYKGKAVTSFWGRAGVGLVLITTWPLCLLILALSVPLHLALLGLGRRGFLQWSGGPYNDDTCAYVVSRAGFLRV